MRDIFSRIFNRSDKGSKEDAKARLKFLLVHDQVDLTPAQMEAMKAELMEVIGRYVEIDNQGVEFRLERDEGTVALVSNIPVRRVTARAC
jgi:cell division topological specificity factor